MTVPAPDIANARSIAMRNILSEEFISLWRCCFFRCSSSGLKELGSLMLVLKIDAFLKDDFSTSSAISCSHSISLSSSTMSDLVSAIVPLDTPISSRMSKCSWLWGIGPSSAAITIRACCCAAIPATML